MFNQPISLESSPDVQHFSHLDFGQEYLRSEAEESLGFHHFLQHVALDARCAVIFVHHAVLQVDVVHRQTHVVLLPVDDGDGVEFVHHL